MKKLRIMRQTGSPMFDPKVMKKNITHKMMNQAYKSFDSIPSIAVNRLIRF